MAKNLITKHIIEAVVKPTLDKAEREKLNADLGRIFADASNIDFNTKETRESLNELVKAFQAIFNKIGDKSIDFDKLIKMPAPDTFAKLGEIAAKQFWDAWNSVAGGMTASTSKEMLREQFKQLEKQRVELIKKQKTLPNKQKKYEDLSLVVDDMPYMATNEFEAFTKKEIEKMGENIDKIATDMLKSMNDAIWNLKGMKLDDPDFGKAFENTLEKARDVFRMSRTLEKTPNLVKNEDVLDDYDFSYLQDTFGDDLSEYSIHLTSIIRRVEEEIDVIPIKLKEIDVQLANIKNSGIDIVDQTSAKSGLKTLNEIEDAYKRILNSKKVNGEYRANQKEIEKIQSALDFDPSQSKQGIKSLYEEYQAAAASGDWTKEYEALLKYVRLYESYQKTQNKTHRNKIVKPGNEFTPLYEQLKPIAKNAENMLRNIVNMAENKPLVGMGGTGDGDSVGTGNGVNVTPEDVANAEKVAEIERQARMEAEAKAKAEQEAKEAAKQKRIEEEKLAKAAEKKRLADEAAAEASRKAAEEAEREKAAKESTHKLNAYTGYRAVEPPSGSGKTKEDALSDWGGEYFSTNKDIAASYGENFFEKGNIVIGEITPKNPLIINANGLRWDQFDKMPGVKEMFPEILELMKQPRYTGDDGQKYINERAKLAGYDAVILENVQDALDGDIKEYGLSTTIAVLDDKIVSLTGSMAQLEAGTNRFSDVISTEIPSYYSKGTDNKGNVIDVGAGSVSSADLEAERAKAEALQNEVEQKNQKLIDQTNELARIQQESDAKLKTANDEKNTLQNDLDNTRQQLADAEYEKGLYDSAMHKIEEESNAKDRIIYELREQLANVKTGTGEEQASVSSKELKNILSTIVYNVKITHDDADKTANKIALDDSALESTLKRVFANILTPQIDSNEMETKSESWALESTLQAVKTVLDTIQTNTTKIGTIPQTPADDLDSILTQISKNVSEINTKVVKGTKATTQKSTTQPKETPSTQRAKVGGTAEIKTLISDYEKLGKLRAQFEKDGNLATQAQLQNLAEEVKRKRESLKLTIDEIISLREKSKVAYEAEKKLLDAAEMQKKINSGRKTADKTAAKDEKKRLANAKKLAQREAMLGKAGNAVGRAENTWMSAVGIEGELPAGFNAEIDEYYKKLDALRKKHQELKNSDMISEEQKKELIAQTVDVNKLTDEIGGLISEYQRLSGDNATVIGANTLGADAGLDAYEQQLKQTVITATNGKAQIKNFDAATKTLTYTVKTGKNEFTEYAAAVRRADNQLVTLQGATKRTETFIEATIRKMKEISSYISGMSILSRLWQELKRGIQYVREIDLALTELRKVTDETEETYDEFLQTAAKTGARLGTTISAVTEATATFAKLGYTIEQSTEMAEAAIVYKNVGDNIESTEDAANSIISTMKGFRLEATESMRIVDRFNEVGNRFAITSQGIGEALRLSASALSEGGNSLDESIGLITAANEVVNDPSSVGTALKTLTLRLRGSKTELEEMGEDVSDMATTTSQLQSKLLALTGGQVDIMLDENTFKNSTQILREMADAWQDMTDIQRASALELMGGRLLPLHIEIYVKERI